MTYKILLWNAVIMTRIVLIFPQHTPSSYRLDLRSFGYLGTFISHTSYIKTSRIYKLVYSILPFLTILGLFIFNRILYFYLYLSNPIDKNNLKNVNNFLKSCYKLRYIKDTRLQIALSRLILTYFSIFFKPFLYILKDVS